MFIPFQDTLIFEYSSSKPGNAQNEAVREGRNENEQEEEGEPEGTGKEVGIIDSSMRNMRAAGDGTRELARMLKEKPWR